jgi:hypothetical protein
LELIEAVGAELRDRWPGATLSAPSGKDFGQAKHLLKTYSAAELLKMVRVLVWDWDVLRATYRSKTIPTDRPVFGHLSIYVTLLAGAGPTGIRGKPNMRGRPKSYQARYCGGDTNDEIDRTSARWKDKPFAW